MAAVTEVMKLRRRVLTEMARMAFEGALAERVEEILQTVATEDSPRYRCCVYKERAVLRERIALALGQSPALELKEAAQNALRGEKDAGLSVIEVMPIACDQCPIDKYFVSNACRNCLAHSCISSCPKQAILVVQNHAYIDKTKCVECGLCKRSCPFGAIIEVMRPCEAACDLGAIRAGSDRRAVIDYDRCAECGGCKTACPFGAIVDPSEIVQIIAAIRAGKSVHALLAPAFIGQFGAKIKPEQVIAALRRIGFSQVQEISFGADITTYEEAREFAATVPKDRPFMTTSCCPAFVHMVEKHLPTLKDKISSAVSPMIAGGRAVKLEDPEAVTVFIGPCIAKKGEASRYAGAIDYVATFEEIACVLVGAGVNLALTEADVSERPPDGSLTGKNFARAGGVAESVVRELEREGLAVPKLQRGEGLKNCKTALALFKAGKTDADFFEGMACPGGCVGGPGALADGRVTDKLVEKYAAAARFKTAGENAPAVETIARKACWHHPHGETK